MTGLVEWYDNYQAKNECYDSYNENKMTVKNYKKKDSNYDEKVYVYMDDMMKDFPYDDDMEVWTVSLYEKHMTINTYIAERMDTEEMKAFVHGFGFENAVGLYKYKNGDFAIDDGYIKAYRIIAYIIFDYYFYTNRALIHP